MENPIQWNITTPPAAAITPTSCLSQVQTVSLVVVAEEVCNLSRVVITGFHESATQFQQINN